MQTNNHEAYLSDAARSIMYRERELANTAARLQAGARVWYYSVNVDDVPERLRNYGTVLACQAGDGLTRVLFDGQPEPEWLDGRLLHST